jgi:hypothetical protein
MTTSSVKTLLNRARRLERASVSPILNLIGSIEEFEANAQAGIAAGIYDPHDMPLVVKAIRRWLDIDSNSP